MFPVSDTTPEGLAKINFRQGNFAVISDEATSINSLLGLTYANSERKTNSELVLKAWDSGHVSIARANAENNMSFTALGCMAVIAQDETISGIMEAGARGIGVSERFLLVREESFLGRRKFVDDNGDTTYTPVDAGLKADYYKLIHNIMTEQSVSLKVSRSAMRVLNMARQEMEPKLADGENILTPCYAARWVKWINKSFAWHPLFTRSETGRTLTEPPQSHERLTLRQCRRRS